MISSLVVGALVVLFIYKYVWPIFANINTQNYYFNQGFATFTGFHRVAGSISVVRQWLNAEKKG